MNDLQLLTMIRQAISTGIDECSRQKYKPEVILKQYREKIQNLMNLIQQDKSKNRKVQSRQLDMLNNAYIYTRCRSFSEISTAMRVKLYSLPSAMDVLEKSKK